MHTKYSITTEPLHTKKEAKGKKKTKRINEQLEKKSTTKGKNNFTPNKTDNNSLTLF